MKPKQETSETHPKATSLRVAEVKNEEEPEPCSHSMIVPVYIYTETHMEDKRLTYALLDPQSDACFVSESVAEQVKAPGRSALLELSTITGKTQV